MKEWKSPFVKCVLLNENDLIATSEIVTQDDESVNVGTTSIKFHDYESSFK